MDEKTAVSIIWGMEGLASWMLSSNKLTAGTRSWLERITGDDQPTKEQPVAEPIPVAAE